MFRPETLEEAQEILTLARSTITNCIAKIESHGMITDDEVAEFIKSSLINLIQSDRTGFLAISMCDRLSESIPCLERLVELIKNEANQQGG
jgi:hypothetical protein